MLLQAADCFVAATPAQPGGSGKFPDCIEDFEYGRTGRRAGKG